MGIRRILGIASLGSIAIFAEPTRARSRSQSQSAVVAKEKPAPDLIVRGRILEESSEPLRDTPGWVVLSSLWTYRIHVVHVIRGREGSEEILAKNTADPALRRDVDFVFELSRNKDGTYRVVKLKRA